MKVLLTRPRKQAEEFARLLRAAGFEPLFFPVIDIRPADDLTPLKRALENIEHYTWIVFTSANAVEVVFSLALVSPSLLSHRERGEGGTRIAAVGSKTAALLRQYGVEPDFVPQEFNSAAILPGLGEVRGKWILLPRADLARPDLPRAILEAGGVAHEIVVYRTLPAQADPAGLEALRSGVDWLTFTSPSTVENFIALTRSAALDPFRLPGDPRLACIGPTTAQAAREAGFSVSLVAREHSAEGLVREMREMCFSHHP